MADIREISPAKYPYGALCFSLLLGALILSPSLWFDLGADQAYYNYVAWAWLEHGLPPCKTNNLCDLPGVIFLTLPALKIFGANVLALRLWDLFIQLANLGMIFHLANRLRPQSAHYTGGIIASGLYALFYLGLGHWNTAQRDGWALPFLLLSALSYLHFYKKQIGLGIFLTGLMTGMAFIMKPTFALTGLVYSLLYLRRAWKAESSWKRIFLEQFCLLLSCLLPLIISLFIFRLSGAGFDYWQDCWEFLTRVYALRNIETQQGIYNKYLHLPALLVYDMLKKDQVIWLGALLTLIYAIADDRLRGERLETFLALTGIWAASLFSHLVQTMNLPYHMSSMAGISTIFAGAFYGSLFPQTASRRAWSSSTALGIVIILGLETASFNRKELKFVARYAFRSLETAYMFQEPWYHRTAEYIKSHTEPDQYVGAFGYCKILFLAERLAPTRQTYLTHLLIKNPRGEYPPLEIKWQNQLCDDVTKRPPVYIVWPDQFEFFGCLKKILDNHYLLETKITDIHGLEDRLETASIYRRK
jgi:hypothetical protein